MNRRTYQLMGGQRAVQGKLSNFLSSMYPQAGMAQKAVDDVFADREAMEQYKDKLLLQEESTKRLGDYNRTQNYLDWEKRNEAELLNKSKAIAAEMGFDPTDTNVLVKIKTELGPALYQERLTGATARTATNKATEGQEVEREKFRAGTEANRYGTAINKSKEGLLLSEGDVERAPFTNRGALFKAIAEPMAIEQDLYKGQFTPLNPGMSYDVRNYQTGNNQLLTVPEVDKDAAQAAALLGKPYNVPKPSLTPSPLNFRGTKPDEVGPDGVPIYKKTSPVDRIIQEAQPQTSLLLPESSFLSTDAAPSKATAVNPFIQQPSLAAPVAAQPQLPPPAEDPKTLLNMWPFGPLQQGVAPTNQVYKPSLRKRLFDRYMGY